MCGIAGILNSERSAPAAVDAMLAAMKHRGPDGRGTMSWPGGTAGMVRLALVDLSDRGQQPIWSADGKVAIVFNGEMYNHAEHRSRLKTNGYAFKSASDTEVVLALFMERGLDFVHAVRGMFALAIVDFRNSEVPTLVLARDPFGIKPLYVARRGKRVAFASELRALKASGLVLPEIDNEALADYLTFGFVLQPRTMLHGVQMLAPGTMLIVEPNAEPREHHFFLMPPASECAGDFEAASAHLRAALEESVRLHAMADAPVGAFLSGGVDSSALVALMARHNARLRTYTVRLKDPQYDESQHAREFAERLGCVHTEVEVGDAEVKELFPRFAASLDQPSTDGFNTWLVSRAAARDVKGVVSGLGGDEWFGGYPVVQRMAKLDLGAATRFFGRTLAGLSPLMPDALGSQTSKAVARASPLAMWAAAHRVFLPHEVKAMAARDAGVGADRLAQALGGRITDHASVDLACQLDVWGYMGCQLLRDSDVTSMASSLELRVPLVDREVAAVARTIAAQHKVGTGNVRSGKRVLVNAVKDLLPTDIHSRPKRGFALPYTEWLAGPLQEIAEDALQSLARRGWLVPQPHAPAEYPQTWSLVVLELWAREFGIT